MNLEQCKNWQNFQRFLNKILSIENGAKECIVYISARAFQRVFTCKIWLRYSRERALSSLPALRVQIPQVNLTINVLRMKSTISKGAGNSVTVKLMGVAAFTALPNLTSTLEKVAPRQSVSVDVSGLQHIDASCIAMMEQWEKRYKSQGGTVSLDWKAVEIRKLPGLTRRTDFFESPP